MLLCIKFAWKYLEHLEKSFLFHSGVQHMVHAQSLLDETLLAFCEEADLALEGTFAKLLASLLGVVMTVAHQNLMTRTNHFSPLRKILPTNTEIAVVIAASVAVADIEAGNFPFAEIEIDSFVVVD